MAMTTHEIERDGVRYRVTLNRNGLANVRQWHEISAGEIYSWRIPPALSTEDRRALIAEAREREAARKVRP
jgi:hypothetical protein